MATLLQTPKSIILPTIRSTTFQSLCTMFQTTRRINILFCGHGSSGRITRVLSPFNSALVCFISRRLHNFCRSFVHFRFNFTSPFKRSHSTRASTTTTSACGVYFACFPHVCHSSSLPLVISTVQLYITIELL